MTETPDVPANGFDIFVENGTSHIVDLNPAPSGDGDDNNDASDEDENEIISGHTPRWNSVQLDILGGEPWLGNPLGPFKYHLAYWTSSEETETVNGEDVTTYKKTYHQLDIKSQTIKIKPGTHPDPPGVFFTNTGEEIYPQVAGISSAATAGGINPLVPDDDIKVRYSYLLVFNEAEISWLPRCSTLTQERITKKTPPVDDDIPATPEEGLPEPYYPMDTLNALVPDPREVVPVVYEVVTEYSVNAAPGIPGASGEFTFDIHHPCVQDAEITAEKMERILNMCYFTHGFYHIQLYNVDDPPNYDEFGDPIPLKDDNGNFILDEDGNQTFNIKQPEYALNQEDTDLVGFDVYDLQNSVMVLNEIDKVPEQEAASEISLQETVDEGQEQIKGLEDLMATTQQEYENEIASIEQIQKDNAEIVRVNEERKSQLLGNIKNMIAGTTSATPPAPEETEEVTDV